MEGLIPKGNTLNNIASTSGGQSLGKSQSAKRLIDLARPKTFKGPEVKVQNEIVRALEEQIEAQIEQKVNALKTTLQADSNEFLSEKKWIEKSYDISFAGAIELKAPTTGNVDLKNLLANAQLINLGTYNKETNLDGHALGADLNIFELVEKAGVKEKLVANTLATMGSAGQLAYLEESGLIDEKWKIIIEIHYYRDRDTSQTKFHKDTKGQTLFVNLNFVNNEPVPGPEYIINPASNTVYDQYVDEHLPPVFVEDLKEAKQFYGEPELIGNTVIEPNGVVAFVDEAIHHKTPTLAHRMVSAGRITTALQKQHAKVHEAYEKYKNRWVNWSFDRYLDEKYKKDAKAWLTLLTTLEKNSQARFDRKQLVDLLPSGAFDIDELIEEGGSVDFGSVTYHHTKPPQHNVKVKKDGRPPLKRQMSQEMLQPVGGKRTFFRTWVRAVPVKK